MDLLAPVLVLLGTFVQFARAQEYPLLSPETLLIAAALVAAGLACGLLARLRPPLLGPLVMAVLVALFADVHLRHTSEVLAFLLALGGGLVLGPHLPTVASAVFGTVLVSTLVLPPASPGPATARSGAAGPAPSTGEGDARALPLVVHLVLDEHIGLQEFPTDDAEARAVKRRLRDFLEEQGFYLFPAAFSQYAFTQHALGHAFNFATTFDPKLSRRSRSDLFEWEMRRNDYFATAARRGYRVHVYQPDFMDLCPPGSIDPSRCRTYRASLARALARTSLSRRARLYVLLGMLVESSSVYRELRDGYHALRGRLGGAGGALPGWGWERARVQPIASLEAWEALRGALARAAPGELHVAHLLLPHFPYMLEADCAVVRDPAAWLYRWPRDAYPERSNTSETRARHYRRYWPQVECARRQTAETLAVLRDRGLLDRSVVILHGDHGSRITLTEPLTSHRDRLTGQDFTDAFSTLFAVRIPRVGPGSDPRAFPITRLLGDLVASDFEEIRGGPAPDRSVVYLQIDGSRRVVPHPLPGAVGGWWLRAPGEASGRR